MGRKRFRHTLLWFIYLFLLFLFVVIKFDGSFSSLRTRLFVGPPSYNLVPFRTLRIQWLYFSTDWGYRNMLGNLLPFIPLGLLTPTAFPTLSHAKSFFLCMLLLLLSLEAFQLFTRLGSFDVDDILLNLLGAGLGFALSHLVKKDRHKP